MKKFVFSQQQKTKKNQRHADLWEGKKEKEKKNPLPVSICRTEREVLLKYDSFKEVLQYSGKIYFS